MEHRTTAVRYGVLLLRIRPRQPVTSLSLQVRYRQLPFLFRYEIDEVAPPRTDPSRAVDNLSCTRRSWRLVSSSGENVWVRDT